MYKQLAVEMGALFVEITFSPTRFQYNMETNLMKGPNSTVKFEFLPKLSFDDRKVIVFSVKDLVSQYTEWSLSLEEADVATPSSASAILKIELQRCRAEFLCRIPPARLPLAVPEQRPEQLSVYLCLSLFVLIIVQQRKAFAVHLLIYFY